MKSLIVLIQVLYLKALITFLKNSNLSQPSCANSCSGNNCVLDLIFTLPPELVCEGGLKLFQTLYSTEVFLKAGKNFCRSFKTNIYTQSRVFAVCKCFIILNIKTNTVGKGFNNAKPNSNSSNSSNYYSFSHNIIIILVVRKKN